MNEALFNGGRGNEEFANLPRKINVCISPSRDDFPHTQVRGGLVGREQATAGLGWCHHQGLRCRRLCGHL
jgi:hypothetical protein